MSYQFYRRATMDKYGIRELVKHGKLSPTEALESLSIDPLASESLVRWLKSAGKKRYVQAIKAPVETKSKITEEPKPEKKKKVKKKDRKDKKGRRK